MSAEVVAVTGLEPEGTGSWLLVAVLALTLLRLCFLVRFFQFGTEAFCFGNYEV